MGFSGKQIIHPNQIEVVQRSFSPQGKELEWAVRVVLGDGWAREEGKGAWRLKGMMVDRPVVERAERVLALARECGVDVDGYFREIQGEARPTIQSVLK